MIRQANRERYCGAASGKEGRTRDRGINALRVPNRGGEKAEYAQLYGMVALNMREVVLEGPVEALLVEVFTKVKAIREGNSGKTPG